MERISNLTRINERIEKSEIGTVYVAADELFCITQGSCYLHRTEIRPEANNPTYLRVGFVIALHRRFKPSPDIHPFSRHPFKNGNEHGVFRYSVMDAPRRIRL